MNLYSYKELEVAVVDEPHYTLNSTDNTYCYSKYYFGENGREYPVSKHGVKVYQDNEVIHDCILIASGGATGIYETSSLIDGNQLLVCCSNTVFNVNLPMLDLNWKKQIDGATCFQLFKLDNDYLIHGEMYITRINRDGIIKWQFAGEDIFVSTANEESFKLKDGYIELKDFSDKIYRLNYDGSPFSKK